MYGDDDDDDLLNSNDLLQSEMIDGDRIIMCVCEETGKRFKLYLTLGGSEKI